MYSYIANRVFNDHLGSSNDSCYIQNCVITDCVIKRLRYTWNSSGSMYFSFSRNFICTDGLG